MQFRLDQLAGLISSLGSAVLESRFIGWDHAKKIRGVNPAADTDGPADTLKSWI